MWTEPKLRSKWNTVTGDKGETNGDDNVDDGTDVDQVEGTTGVLGVSWKVWWRCLDKTDKLTYFWCVVNYKISVLL